MRIAFIDYILEPDKPGASGLSDIVWNMARELVRFGDDVHIVAPYSVEPESVPGITIHRFTLPPIGYRNVIGHLLIALKAWRVARSIPNLDVIHAPEYLSTGVIAPLSRVPVVLTVPGHIDERIANGNPFDVSMTQVLKLASRSSSRFCRVVITTSADMTRWWTSSGVSTSRLCQIPYGVDTSVFYPRNRQESKAELGLDPRKKYVTYVGRLSAEKNLDVLLRAFASIRDGSAQIELLLAGEGPARQDIETLARQLGVFGRVRWTGWLPAERVPTVYGAADVVVLPSRSEGMPRVMVEALSSGRLFVGTRISGIRDHIADTTNGLLVEPGSVEDLTAAISSALSDDNLRTSIEENARAYAERNLSWRAVCRMVRQDAYSRLLPRPPLDGRAPAKNESIT